MQLTTWTGADDNVDDFRRPAYNIKAVVEATGLPAATLRAWERRYGALAPGRTESGYRLYSARDVAVLRWLKSRVDEGMTISQAIALLGHRKPDLQASHPAAHRHSEPGQGVPAGRDALAKTLLAFDEPAAEHVLQEAFAAYGIEAVTEHHIMGAMVQIGDLWHRGQVTTAAEHFASNYLRRKLEAIVNSAPYPQDGPLVVLGCAPDDWHELGLMLTHMLLRRRGVRAVYLGQNVPIAQFAEQMTKLQPAMVIISAATDTAAQGLIQLSHEISRMPAQRPIFAYGGRVFSARPELRAEVSGVFLGETARAAVEYALALLKRHSWPPQEQALGMSDTTLSTAAD